MTIQDQAGNAVLASAGGAGVVNLLSQVDLFLSIIVGALSAIGIVYSIVWHRVRIKQAKEKSRAKSD